MAKRKVRPHPGVLAQLLKDKNMTQAEVAASGGIDRKTQAKINRGEEVKQETLQKLADKLKVPITYFDPSAGKPIEEVESPLEEIPGWLSLLLRRLDAHDVPGTLVFVDRECI